MDISMDIHIHGNPVYAGNIRRLPKTWSKFTIALNVYWSVLVHIADYYNPKITMQQCTPATHAEAVHCQRVLLGVFHPCL